jgi:hypothetical protein
LYISDAGFLCSRRKRSREVYTQEKYFYISDSGFSAVKGKGVGQFSFRENTGIISKLFSLL